MVADWAAGTAEQLRLEEALLRGDKRDWLLINDGVPLACVLGRSGKPQQMLHVPLVQRLGVSEDKQSRYGSPRAHGSEGVQKQRANSLC